MTAESQRMAIAEALGWRKLYSCLNSQTGAEIFWWRNGDDSDSETTTLPDYLNDLNVMHEARLSLNCLQQNQFAYELVRVLGINSDQLTEACVLFELVNATAAQRAEAWLKALNLWTEE